MCFSVYSNHSSPHFAQNNPLQELLCLWEQGIQWELLWSSEPSAYCSKANTVRNPELIHSSPLLGNLPGSTGRILVSGPLAFGEAVLVTDPCHQVLQPCDPGPCFLGTGGHQVQGLHVVPVVDAEAAVGVEAAIGVALEDLRLLPFTHLLDGVDGNCSDRSVQLINGCEHALGWAAAFIPQRNPRQGEPKPHTARPQFTQG